MIGKKQKLIMKICAMMIVCLFLVTNFSAVVGVTQDKLFVSDLSEKQEKEPTFAPDEMLIKLKENITNITITLSENGYVKTGIPSLDVLNERYKVTVMQKLFVNEKKSNRSQFYKLTFHEDIDILSSIAVYEKNSNIEYAEPNYQVCDNPQPPALQADAHGPYYGYIGTSVQFTGSATGGYTPYSWSWDFDNSNGIQVESNSQNPTHVYTGVGVYTATLTVTDSHSTHVSDTATVTITFSVADSHIMRGTPDSNYGGSSPLHMDSQTLAYERALVNFDLSSIPPYSIINSATLKLYYYGWEGHDPTTRPGGEAYHDLGCYRILASWTEGGVTWNNRKSGTPWTTPGGDVNPTQTAFANIPGSTGQDMLWDVKSDVQSFVNQESINYGWLIGYRYEGSAYSYLAKFYSKEGGGASPGPRLVIDYTPTYTIYLYTNPSGGTINFNYNNYDDGTPAHVVSGEYWLQANHLDNYVFDYWSISGGVSVDDEEMSPTFAHVSGNGSITAHFTYVPPPPHNGTIFGYVKDSVTGDGIGDALVVTEPGGYSTHTLGYDVQVGRYQLNIPPGFYNVTVSKEGYESNTLYDVVVEPDGWHHLPDFQLIPSRLIPNDPYFTRQWGLQQANDCDIDAPEAWHVEIGSSDVIIAVIDSGIDYNHPDLRFKIWSNADETLNGIDDDGNGFVDDVRGWDFVNNDNDPIDDFGHGTHCSGIAAADTNNGRGIAGVCWRAKIMPLKGSDSTGAGYIDVLAAAIYYAADNGAKVISMSWGGYFDSQIICDAVDYAYSMGVALVAAAGNDWCNLEFFPAAYENVIAVGALDSSGGKAGFSNWGPWVDIAAPGAGIYSTMPTYHVTMNDDGYAQNYDNMSGTSMSCPYVAGLIALIISENESYNNTDINTILCQGVDNVAMPNTHLPEYIGRGRINAYRAVKVTPPLDAVAKILTPVWYDAFSKGKTSTIAITGDAIGTHYAVEYGKGVYPENWNSIATGSPEVNSFSVVWNIGAIDNGVYQIRLTVNNTVGIMRDFVQIYISPLSLEWKTHFGHNLYNAPTAKDIDGDGVSEILLYDQNDNSNSKLVCVDGLNGSRRWEYPFGDNYTIWALPQAVGDLDNDGNCEIVAGILCDGVKKEHLCTITAEGTLLWEHYFDHGGLGYITLVDLNNDNKLEILIGADNGVYCFNSTGAVLWFCNLGNTPGFFATGDLTNEGYVEIIAVPIGSNFIYCLDHEGVLKWSYNSEEYDLFYSAPILSDTDGDGSLEIFIGSRYLNCFNNTGSLKWRVGGGPSYVSASKLSAADIDNDGFSEVVCSRQHGVIDVYEGSGILRWAKYCQASDCYPIMLDCENDGDIEVVSGCQEGGYGFLVGPGNGVNSHIFALNNSGGYDWFYPPLQGWTSEPFFVGDIDGDGKLEMMVNPCAYPYSYLYCFEISGGGDLAWPMFQHDEKHTGLYQYDVEDNAPPDSPTIDGFRIVIPGIPYYYSVSAVDPEHDGILYWIDWGDGTNSGWFGPYDSGEKATLDHEWDTLGTFIVKARAMDIHGAISDWETLEILVPASQPCFLAGTKILMADGKTKNIEDIKIGDLVKAYNTANKVSKGETVTKIYHHTPQEMGDYYLVINKNLKVTPNHPLFINGVWKKSGDAKVGDCLLGVSNSSIPITSIEKVYIRVDTYNFNTIPINPSERGMNTYFVQGMLAHGKGSAD